MLRAININIAGRTLETHNVPGSHHNYLLQGGAAQSGLPKLLLNQFFRLGNAWKSSLTWQSFMNLQLQIVYAALRTH